MVGPSTRRALNTRALRIADWLHYRAEQLEDEMQRRGWAEQRLRNNLGPVSSIERDGEPVMVSLKASDLLNLILQMYEQEAELRRFAEPEPPRKSVRHSPRGFR
jgi:hypothetical protein